MRLSRVLLNVLFPPLTRVLNFHTSDSNGWGFKTAGKETRFILIRIENVPIAGGGIEDDGPLTGEYDRIPAISRAAAEP